MIGPPSDQDRRSYRITTIFIQTILPLTLMITLLFIFPGCAGSGGGDSVTTDPPVVEKVRTQFTFVDRLTMASGASAAPYTVTVPEGSVSLTIMADGVDTSDMDISSIITPAGEELITSDPDNGPIGFHYAQGPGQSAVSFTLPHSGDYALTAGEWSYTITHFRSPDGKPREVTVHTLVKPRTGDTIDMNLWIVALPDYTGEADPVVAALMDRFRFALGNMGLTLDILNIIEMTGAAAERLTYVNFSTDSNRNNQPDDMDELFALSSQADNDYLNIFLVAGVQNLGVLGVAGGIPAPQLIQGTAHSGVFVNTFGGLTSMSPADISMQGDTMAHELGHVLGLFHTTEKNGALFDPISDTPQCRREERDSNGDGVVGSPECESLDGANIMFWSAAQYPQEVTSPMQQKVLSVTPAVR